MIIYISVPHITPTQFHIPYAKDAVTHCGRCGAGTDTHWLLPGRDRCGRGLFIMTLKDLDLSKGSVEQYQMEVGSHMGRRKGEKGE